MFDDSYSIKIDIFEGPMDLLVFLVRKNDVDIRDIPIALITEQFLAYLDLMELMNIDYAGDFLYMAATLAHIKSKLLLPRHEYEDDEDDPRLEIARPLMEYLRLKSAADILDQKDILGVDTFRGVPYIDQDLCNDDSEPLFSIDLFELVETYRIMSSRDYKSHQVDLTTRRMTVKDRMNEIIAVLQRDPIVCFHDLIGSNHEKHRVVITFLALLEMAKLNLIELEQTLQAGKITILYV
jgi:segregation and condensation protein A